MRLKFDRLGIVGLFLIAIIHPCCFPLFGIFFIALGFGSLELFGSWTMYVFQIFILISVAGLFFTYRKHKSFIPLLCAALSALFVLYGYYINESDNWRAYLYIGMFGLLISSGIDYYKNKQFKKNRTMELKSLITCPNCGHSKEEIMPIDACQYFYECESCHVRLKPKQGDCCVYCSYGSVKCPPIQNNNNCC